MVCVPFIVLVSAAELGNMSIHDYINYVNPPAVHNYKHDNGDSILCVKFTDQISLHHGKQEYGYARKNSNIGWRDVQAGEPSSNISDSGLRKRCPEGTVSVMEIKYEQVKAVGSVNMFLRRKMRQTSTLVHEYAVAQFSSDGVYRAQGTINVWQPYVASDGVFSLGQIWVINDHEQTTQTVEAGWEVFPSHYGDSRPRLFVSWTADNYNSTGCSNLDCPGFVSVNSAHYYPGQPLKPISEYGKDQFEMEISIIRKVLKGKVIWSLYIEKKFVGYWPGSLFGSLAKSANAVDYGGEVVYHTNVAGTPLSKTHMGSGRFPQEGFSNAVYIKNIEMYNSNGNLMHPQESIMTRKGLCYNLTLGDDNTTSKWGHYMFFGGPGGDNHHCLN